jgi:predicted metal-dependent hydrolase
VFHLTEELLYREDLTNLPDSDYQHLSNDIIRIYKILFDEWLRYVEHLRREYPYLFSLVLRTNPFNPEASVIVKK